jgi:preprotein translocase subunit SecA
MKTKQQIIESRNDPALTFNSKANQDEIKNSQAKDNSNQKEKNLNTPLKKLSVGRNDLCPCGSDKKYKHCHGKN